MDPMGYGFFPFGIRPLFGGRKSQRKKPDLNPEKGGESIRENFHIFGP